MSIGSQICYCSTLCYLVSMASRFADVYERNGDACAPVLFISASSEHIKQNDGFRAGGVDYLAKPIQAKDALLRIRAHLGNHLYARRQQQLATELGRANEAKNKFIGMCAHDLRNPLASIRGLAEFLQDPALGKLTTEQSAIVSSIRDASQTMLTLVNELLDISTIESGALNLTRADVSIHELAAKAIRLASFNAARKGMSITLSDTSASPALSIDAPKIRQVLDNLISNAIKFSPPGSAISVAIGMPPKEAPAGFASVSVRDQGPGIPEAEHDRLFKDFSLLSTQPTGGEKCTGLGLMICRKIVEAHGGTIEAVNQPDGGCVFSFTLQLST
jgi:two-component system, sensor histidine kinase and response regulator